MQKDRECARMSCANPVQRGPRANNKKYCSKECQHAVYSEKNHEKSKAYQRERWRNKTKGEKIKCAICGEEYRKVGSHVTQMHGLTAREYREQYGFDVKRGQVPEDLRETLATNAIENGTAGNLQNGSKFRFKVGHRMSYTRSKQTMKRLKQQSFIKNKISK